MCLKKITVPICTLKQYLRAAYGLGRGINVEGFKSKLTMVKMCSTWSLLNKYALWKKFEVGLQTPPLPQTPYRAYGKGQNLKIWILFLPWSKCIHSNLKGMIIPFKQNSDVIYRPHSVQTPWSRIESQMADFDQKLPFLLHLTSVGYVKPFEFCIKCLSCSF